ncbi:hypothetical protein ACN38_g9519 [Penicillium nordicum]|uniref:Uncharacterized protein n=1 Tax=Penicillium nordicum TaxID=229535 RepID=A0A0M9WCT5_9EURO|nr:hypothetical protein ACN38_g9519 [Penicillium nordicum]
MATWLWSTRHWLYASARHDKSGEIWVTSEVKLKVRGDPRTGETKVWDWKLCFKRYHVQATALSYIGLSLMGYFDAGLMLLIFRK